MTMSDPSNPYQTDNTYSMGTTVNASANVTANPAPPTSGAGVVAIKDISSQDFGREVIEASRNGPVVVDFWAPWCGPCKQLGPIIEKAVQDTKGAVTLCKMDIEQYPDVAGQMGIQSIPAVVAFVDGRPADAFMGAKPESEVRAFIDKLAANAPKGAGSEIAEALEEADGLATDGDHAAAAELYGHVLAAEPGNLDALAGLGQCYVAVDEMERAQELVDQVPDEHRSKGPLAVLIKTMDLAAQADALGDVGKLAAAVEADPKNHQARFDYAIALNAQGNREEAAEQLVEIVRTDRKWNDDGAREKLLEFFEAWGNTDPATISGRRALSSVLFS